MNCELNHFKKKSVWLPTRHFYGILFGNIIWKTETLFGKLAVLVTACSHRAERQAINWNCLPASPNTGLTEISLCCRWKGENVATTEVADVVGMLDFIQETNVYGVPVPGSHLCRSWGFLRICQSFFHVVVILLIQHFLFFFFLTCLVFFLTKLTFWSH